MIILLLFGILFCFSKSNDLCNIPLITDYDKAMGCLRSVPFSKSIRDKTMGTVGYLFKNYVFQDIIRDSRSSGSPFTVNLDITKQISDISSQTFNSDFDFHSSLQSIFLKLGDIGTSYKMPACYTAWEWSVPVTISNDELGKIRLTSKPSLLNDFNNIYESFDNSEVIEVSGIPIEEYLGSQNTHVSRDPGTRRNFLLKGLFEKRDMRIQDFPKTRNLSMLVNTSLGESFLLQYEWEASSAVDFSKIDFENYCGYKKESKRRSISALPEIDISIKNELSSGKVNDNENFDLLAYHTNEQLYISRYHPDIALIRLRSFDKTNLENDDSMVNHYFEILHLLHDRNVKKLLLDVRGNSHPVGDFCLPFVFAKLISPYAPLSIPGNSDIYGSDAHKSHFCRGNIDSKKLFFNQERKAVAGLFRNKRTLLRGGKTADYSSIIHMSCRQFDEEMDVLVGKHDFINSPNTFYPENLVVLTDGTCSGACGSFISLVRELRLGKIITMGGRPGGHPLNIGSHKGGLMKTIEEYNKENSYWSNIITCTFCKCKTVEELPSSSASFTYTWMETYPWAPPASAPFDLTKGNVSIPQSWKRLTPDFSIDAFESLTGDDVWDEIIPKYFGEICNPEWEVKLNNSIFCPQAFAHVDMGNPCDPTTGNFDYSRCVVKRCQSGYYLNEARDKCLEMPVEEDYNHFLDDFPNILMYSPIFFFVMYVLCCIITIVVCYACYLGRKRKKEKEQELKEIEIQLKTKIPEMGTDDDDDDDNVETTPLLGNGQKENGEREEEEGEEVELDDKVFDNGIVTVDISDSNEEEENNESEKTFL